jgi:hypothetical protein
MIGAMQHADDARSDDGAEDGACAIGAGLRVGHRDHRADGSEGHAHHHRQLDAEPAAEAQRLDHRDDAATEQVRRDQQGHLFRAELERPPHDQGHGDRTGIHHQNVL